MHNVKNSLQRFPAWILTIITLGLILWLTLAPRPLGEVHVELFPGADKVVHALMSGFLTFVVFIDRLRGNFRRSISPLFATFTFFGVSLLGVAIEFIQDAMGMGRSFDLMDMVADATGSLAVTVVWMVVEKRMRKNDFHND